MAEDKPKLSRESAIKTIEELREQLQEVTDAKTITKIVKEEVYRDVVIVNSGQSETLGAIALSLSKAQGEFENVGKSTEAYNYKYATLADTLKMIKPTMVRHELSIVHMNVSKMQGKTLLSGVKSILMHSSGEWLSSESYLPTFKTKSNNTAQVQGSWQSYQKRYNTMSLLNLATEDTDGTS